MIEYKQEQRAFVLKTKNTCYAFKIVDGKYLFHLYYGAVGGNIDFGYLPPKAAYVTNPRGRSDANFSLETIAAEYAYYGTGDFRTSSLCIRTAEGDSNVMFYYIGHKIFSGAESIPGLPSSRDDGCETLKIDLYDTVCRCRLFLFYKVYEENDVITRYAQIINEGNTSVEIEKCMSLCLDLQGQNFDVITLSGCYGNEMNISRNAVVYGKQSVSSNRGATGHNANPFLAVCEKNATYSDGCVYGFNLVYSGNFLSETELRAYSLEEFEIYNMFRIQSGINPENLLFTLKPAESFFAPEAIMTFSDKGLNKMSQNFHAFIKEHILPLGNLKRPIVLNTWEACFYNINEQKLLEFARRGAEIGVDTLVIDDGWFGNRDSDRESLGDWFVNKKKFKNGLKGFSEKISSYVKLGIWIEPESISEDSDLYRKHPEWVLGRVKRPLSTGRNQLVLDFTNSNVIQYLKTVFSNTFEGIKLAYIKWDMNRNLTEIGTSTAPNMSVGETAYRYMCGVYDLLSWFHAKFPDAVFETCSGGGGRYDLGMAAFSSLIWTSDNTFPEGRMFIQAGAMLAYPACLMSCHVSAPRKAITDENEWNLRFVTAAQGMLGYELDICRLSDETRCILREQIRKYQYFRHVIENGKYAVISAPQCGDTSIYYYFTEKEILLSILWKGKGKFPRIFIPDANENVVYKEVFSGKIVNGKELKNGGFYKIPNERTAEIHYYIQIDSFGD